MSSTVRLGIDVGGTFTDLYLAEETSGRIVRHKIPSTPEDPYLAPITGLSEILQDAGVRADQVSFVGLGTTVATNALLERKGAVTGLITTKGFRDLLEIGRQRRPHLYDLFEKRPPPLVSRERRLEVAERMAADGTIIQDLDRKGVGEALASLLEQGVTSIAICFLNSYAFPDHEHRAAEIIRQRWPGGCVTTSHDLLPEFREYERHASTVVNAYLMPLMIGYLSRFNKAVKRLGIPAEPWVMNSANGVLSPTLAGRRPIETVLSGPSGGVSAATYLATLSGHPDIITFDMGGTSTDVCLVRDGRPEITQDRSTSGLPIRSTAVDIHTVGAGGSSIAWLDGGGFLRVGPQSAGAKPGPACYIDGGDMPTVTDANLVLGRLNPRHFLGGQLKIDRQRAMAAIDASIGQAKGLDLHEAAAAVLAVSNTNIAQAIRFVSVERGLDPSEYVLVAFGGAGPLHAAALARELGMSVLIPEAPGVLCAMGVLTKDVQISQSQTRILKESSSNLIGDVATVYAELEARARTALSESSLDTSTLVIEKTVDARYAGQNFELSVRVADGDIDKERIATISSDFHAEHRRLYGYDQSESEIELVTFRLNASLPVAKLELKAAAEKANAGPLRRQCTRQVYFEEEAGFVDCPIYNRADLGVGREFLGPAIVEQLDTTTVIPPDFRARVDEFLSLHLQLH